MIINPYILNAIRNHDFCRRKVISNNPIDVFFTLPFMSGCFGQLKLVEVEFLDQLADSNRVICIINC